MFRLLRTIPSFNPFPNEKFYSSKLKEFTDDNIKFDENGRKLSKRIENTVGKGEIASYKQFLLFPKCFQKILRQTRKSQGLFGKTAILSLSQTSPGF